jgi:hypothetical protein
MGHVSKLAGVFNQMKQRCRNPNNEKYPRYGGRGIEVRFTGWAQFRDWAYANGYREGLTIDRIDNDGHYEPSNCRWVDLRAQQRNTSKNSLLTAFGETKTVVEWSEDPRCVVGYVALVQRVRKGKNWTPEEVLTTPLQPNQLARVVPGGNTNCPAGHDYSETRRWNKRGDYYCAECNRERSREVYRRKVGSRGRDAAA